MDQYIPPIAAVATGICVVFLCFLIRIPFFIVGLLSILLVIYALNDHFYRFATDYRNFSAPDFLKQNASILIIALVIILSLGFLLLKFGTKAVSQNQPTTNHGTTSSFVNSLKKLIGVKEKMIANERTLAENINKLKNTEKPSDKEFSWGKAA